MNQGKQQACMYQTPRKRTKTTMDELPNQLNELLTLSPKKAFPVLKKVSDLKELDKALASFKERFQTNSKRNLQIAKGTSKRILSTTQIYFEDKLAMLQKELDTLQQRETQENGKMRLRNYKKGEHLQEPLFDQLQSSKHHQGGEHRLEKPQKEQLVQELLPQRANSQKGAPKKRVPKHKPVIPLKPMMFKVVHFRRHKRRRGKTLLNGKGTLQQPVDLIESSATQKVHDQIQKKKQANNPNKNQKQKVASIQASEREPRHSSVLVSKKCLSLEALPMYLKQQPKQAQKSNQSLEEQIKCSLELELPGCHSSNKGDLQVKSVVPQRKNYQVNVLKKQEMEQNPGEEVQVKKRGRRKRKQVISMVASPSVNKKMDIEHL